MDGGRGRPDGPVTGDVPDATDDGDAVDTADSAADSTPEPDTDSADVTERAVDANSTNDADVAGLSGSDRSLFQHAKSLLDRSE